MSMELQTLPVLGIIFLSTLTRSTFGFGDALVAMPLLSLIVDVRLAAPLIALISTTMAAGIVAKEWRRIDFASTKWLLISTGLGLPFGLMLLTSVDASLVKLILAVVIILFSVFNLLRRQVFVLQSERSAGFFGLCAGVLGGAYNICGPPVVMYGVLRNWSAEDFRATLQGYFLPTGLLILAGHGASGLWVPTVFWLYLTSLPVVGVSLVAGKAVNRRLEAGNFIGYVHGMLILIGTLLFLQQILPEQMAF